uniref:Phosphoinositide-3-kinase regulatory subunit 6 n=1 Tax=Strix occidentalis caurina TaxID=311401 RepID=A0A8D0EYK6_STROC
SSGSDVNAASQRVISAATVLRSPDSSMKWMLRWTLHKKIDQNPSNSSILVRILVKELERAERGDFRHYIIPLLHTLMYTLIKAPCISDELCGRVYDFCKKLLTLPKPFCTIGLDYAIRLKMERTLLGPALMSVTGSPRLISLFFHPPAPRRIFIFADPELLSEAICNALVTDTEAAQVSQSPRACMCYVIIHAMQAALGEGCDINSLKASSQGGRAPGAQHGRSQPVSEAPVGVEALVWENCSCVLQASLFPPGDAPVGGLQGTPLPNPNISFHLWTEDDQLWKELVLFIRPLSQSCEPDCLSQDLDNFEIQDIISDCECCEQTRFSVLSTDSGIERDLPVALEESYAPCSTETEQSRLHRKGGIKKKLSPLESVTFLQAGCNGPGVKSPAKLQRRPGIPPEPAGPLQRLHTARIVLLGDDRILGRLAQAYHSLRKRETRRVFLTPRLNLQFYYVPVVTGQPNTLAVMVNELCEVAGYLGRVDPWYKSNINTLCHMIPKLATMPSSPSKHLVTDLFITDVIAYYVRMGIQPVCFQVYAVKVGATSPEPAEDVFLTEMRTQVQESISYRGVCVPPCRVLQQGLPPWAGLLNRAKELAMSLRSTGLVMKAIPANEAEDLMCLNVNITEVVRINNLSGRSFSNQVLALKGRFAHAVNMFLCFCSVEVSPCLEPSYCLQKTRTMKFNLHETEDVGLVKYMPKSLLLPINTFAGVIQ